MCSHLMSPCRHAVDMASRGCNQSGAALSRHHLLDALARAKLSHRLLGCHHTFFNTLLMTEHWPPR